MQVNLNIQKSPCVAIYLYIYPKSPILHLHLIYNKTNKKSGKYPIFYWCAWRESNPRQTRFRKPPLYPTELQTLTFSVEKVSKKTFHTLILLFLYRLSVFVCFCRKSKQKNFSHTYSTLSLLDLHLSFVSAEKVSKKTFHILIPLYLYWIYTFRLFL